MTSNLCGARRRKCRGCERRFDRTERALDVCPDCGEARACRNRTNAANGRCRFHGGRSPAPGVEHPNWRHGLRSKAARDLTSFMGGKLEHVGASLAESDSLADATHVVRTLLAYYVSQLDEEKALKTGTIENLLKLVDALRKCLETEQKNQASKAVTEAQLAVAIANMTRIIQELVPIEDHPRLRHLARQYFGVGQIRELEAVATVPPATADERERVRWGEHVQLRPRD